MRFFTNFKIFHVFFSVFYVNLENPKAKIYDFHLHSCQKARQKVLNKEIWGGAYGHEKDFFGFVAPGTDQ